MASLRIKSAEKSVVKEIDISQSWHVQSTTIHGIYERRYTNLIRSRLRIVTRERYRTATDRIEHSRRIYDNSERILSAMLLEKFENLTAASMLMHSRANSAAAKINAVRREVANNKAEEPSCASTCAIIVRKS